MAKEREEIQERFSTAILEIQQKAGLKYMLLEKKILVLRYGDVYYLSGSTVPNLF